MSILKIKAYAKINTSLKILSKRSDGYHEIETIMQNISLYDELFFSITDDNKFEILIDDNSVPKNEKNVCYQVWNILKSYTNENFGTKIEIKKKIPVGAGLGGGSSDAAATIFALNNLWKLSLTKRQMLEVAAKVGSDVPFFIYGGKALCTGRGEIVKRLPFLDTDKFFVIVVKPDESVNTKLAYEEWDKNFLNEDYNCIGSKEGGMICYQKTPFLFQNDFEKVIFTKYPNIKRAKDLLLKYGAIDASLTGSGSAVFGKVLDYKKGQEILSKILKDYSNSFLVETIDRSIELFQ